MMIHPIFDLNTDADPLLATDDLWQSFLDKLMHNLAHLTEASDAERADDVLDRADAYADSQPSFAADLRAAVAPEVARAIA